MISWQVFSNRVRVSTVANGQCANGDSVFARDSIVARGGLRRRRALDCGKPIANRHTQSFGSYRRIGGPTSFLLKASHSYRSVIIGSIRVARRAGIQIAPIAIATSRMQQANIVVGSSARIPNK